MPIGTNDDSFDNYRNWMVMILQQLDSRTELLLEKSQSLDGKVQLTDQKFSDLERVVTQNVNETKKITEEVQKIKTDVHGIKIKYETRHEGYGWLAKIGWGIILLLVGAGISYFAKS